MENLVPREVYDTDETGYWQRLPWIAGVAFGVPMGVVLGMIAPGVKLTGRLLVGCFCGALAGLVFGVLFPRRFRRKMASLANAIYAGNPEITNEPPAGRDVRYRLPCSWLKRNNFAVGGVLYIGRQGLFFAPHRKNLKRDCAAFEIGPADQIRLSLLQPTPSRIVRILTPHPPKKLEVVAQNSRSCFLIPEPERVIEMIRRRIQEACGSSS